MKTDNYGRLAAAAALLLAGGCSPGGAGVESASNFGEALQQTLAAQVIDPNPVYTDPVPATNGQHTAAAIERYRKGQVKRPERQATSSIKTSGGGSGSGGGSN